MIVLYRTMIRQLIFFLFFHTAYENRGAAYGYKGDHHLAIKDFNHVIAFDPYNAKNAMSYFNRGGAYECLNDLDCAMQDYDMAIKLKP